MKTIILMLLAACYSVVHAQTTTNTDTSSTQTKNAPGVIPTNPNTSGPQNTVNETMPGDMGSNKNNMNAMSWKGDSIFVLKAGDGGMMEVKLAQLALTKSTNKEVKSFAKTMQTDHGKANTELKTLAKTLGIKLPTQLSKKAQDDYDKLAKVPGSEFDKAYIKAMVKDHEETVDMFNDAAGKADNASLRSWASQKLPTLKHHLHMAKEMDEKGK